MWTGKFFEGTGANSALTCMSCDVGKYAVNSINQFATDCALCPAGTANGLTGSQVQTACIQCQSGTFSGNGASVCVNCHVTQDSVAGSTLKSDCKCNTGYTGQDGANLCTQCVAGKYKNGNNPGVCTSCPSKTYNGIAGLSGSASCIACPLSSNTTGVGKTSITDCKCDQGTFVYTTTGSEWVCNQCGPGKFSDKPHSDICDSCEQNYYQDIYGATTAGACQSCPANSNSAISTGSHTECLCNMGYSGVAGETCIACESGKYSDSQTQNNAFCDVCGAGKITTSTATTTSSGCILCGTGKYASQNQDECIDCPADTYCSNGIKILCTNFCANTLNPVLRSSSSNACVCVAGTFLSNTVCSTCTASFYCGGTANARTPCPINSQSIASSTVITACKCKPGYHGEDGTVCSACVAGTYKILEGNIACTACGAGLFSENTARTIANACQQCQPGTASNITIAASCTACDKGKYSTMPQTLVCTSCESGKWSDIPGAASATTCQWCGAGKFQRNEGANSADLCLVCPVGKTKSWPS